MTDIPLIRVNVLHGVIALLQQIDAPIDRLLIDIKLPPLILHEPETWIPLKQVLQLIETAASTEGIAHFGLLAGQQTHIARMGALGRLLTHSLTLYDALRTLITLIHSYNSGDRIWLEYQAETVWLCRQFTQKLEAEHPQSVQCSLMILIHLVQLAAGSDWHPTDIQLTTDPIQTIHEIELFANTQIQFKQDKTAIAIPKNFLSLPLQSSSQYSIQQRDCDYEILCSSTLSNTFLVSLKRIIRTQLTQGYPTIESTAEIFGTSVRSFQRQLHQANLTYSHIIEQVRLEQSLQLLSDPMNKVADIATIIGYKDAGNFARAFKRWTGISPKAYAMRHLNIDVD